MSNRTPRWNVLSSAADMLDPLRTVLGVVRARAAEDDARRDELLGPDEIGDPVAQHHCDAEISTEVEERLAADDRLRGSAIHVDAVYDGVVTLGGSAASPAAHCRAFDDAMSVPGVRRVVTEVSTDDAQDAA